MRILLVLYIGIYTVGCVAAEYTAAILLEWPVSLFQDKIMLDSIQDYKDIICLPGILYLKVSQHHKYHCRAHLALWTHNHGEKLSDASDLPMSGPVGRCLGL